MPARLVHFDAADGVALGGLLFEPRRPKKVVVFLHGTGGASVFESPRTMRLAARFLDRGVAYFPFNNRGANVIRRLRSRTSSDLLGGMAHELIRDCIPDIDGAIRFLRREGYRDITLLGHSTGANKIAVYNFYRPRNAATRYVLLAGGDDTGLMYEKYGARRFRQVLDRARQRRRSSELAPSWVADPPMSWRAVWDMIHPDGDYNVFPFLEAWGRVRLSRKPLFRHVKSIRKPALAIYGENDEYCFGDVPGCVAAMADAVGPRTHFEYAIMRGANHGFTGYEWELADLIADWLTCYPG
jgi:pimeloyl-ACP methyl ester carboxylesterase